MYIIQNEIGSASIDVNFHLLKSLEIFDKNSADKIQSNKCKVIKVKKCPPSCQLGFIYKMVENKTMDWNMGIKISRQKFTCFLAILSMCN